MTAPDLSALTHPQLAALRTALDRAIAAAEAAGGGEFAADIIADAEGVSVAFTVFIDPEPGGERHG